MPATNQTETYRAPDGWPAKRHNSIYAAETCTIEFSPALRGFRDDIRSGLERTARETMRQDWMRVNMQDRPYAELIVNDEVSFEYHIGLQTMRYTARCTGENLVTILSEYEI